MAEWITKEVRIKVKLNYDPKVFLLVEDHLAVRLKSDNFWQAAGLCRRTSSRIN